MSRIEGGLAAVVIQDLARELKESSEADLDLTIRSAASRVLDIDPESVPPRLITSLARGGTSKASRQRAKDAIALVVGRSLSSESSENSINESIDFEQVIDQILRDTEDDRRETHALRTQASFIRGVCRPMYTSWIDDIDATDARDLLPREYLERKQDEMINFPISSDRELSDWVNEMFERFERLADVKQESGGAQGLVNRSAVRTYRNAWIGFASRNLSSIWEEMLRRAEHGITDKAVRDEKFHRSRDLPRYSMKYLRSDFGLEIEKLEPPKASTSVTVTLEERGTSPVTLKKSWTSIKTARKEIEAWLTDAKSILGDIRVDLAKVEVMDTSGNDEFALEEVPITGIAGLFTRYLDTKN
jgi:hypothetical protein